MPTVYSVILNYFGKDGIADWVVDKECLARPELVASNYYIRKGEEVYNKTKVFRKLLMLTLCSESLDSLIDAVEYVNSKVEILDSEQRDLVYERITRSELLCYKCQIL